MNELLKLLGIGVLTAALAGAINQIKPEAAVFVSAAGGVLLLSSAIGILSPYFDAIKSVSSEIPEYASVMLKALGVGLITKSASDTCRDVGQTSLASKMELAGRAEILIIGLPVIKKVLEAIKTLIAQ